MERNFAALPHEYLEEFDALSDAEFGRLVRSLLKYSMTGEAISLTGNERYFANRVMKRENSFSKDFEDLNYFADRDKV